MSGVMTEEEFAQKVQWEGGVLGALDYGLTPEHVVPGVLQDAWTELWQNYQIHIKDQLADVEILVEDLAEPV